MSSNRINVNLAFSAETGKAKQQIQELQTLLSKIAYQGATTSSTDKLSTDLHQASEAAKELQFHLNNAFNATTGNFDLSLLDKSLKTSSSNITDLSTKLLSAGQTGQQAFLKLAQSISMADQPMFKINSKLKELGVSIKNAARWQISSNIIHGLQGGIQSAYNYAQDLNKSLNNIRIVTGYNVDKMAEFAEQANKAAKALSTTTTDYTDASLIYFQQGLSDAEVQGRTDTTIKLANVTGQSVEETANQMTAIWNNFDDGSKSLDYYADVITALGAATASSSKEISEGLNKFSAIAESVGLSYEYASTALATVTATTRQSADIVGNSFKTLFARIQGLKLGETLDDGTTLNKYSEALFKVGINIKDQSGQLKDMNTILDEMGSKWNTLGKDQQIALAQTVGGVRQYTQLIALMDNWDYFQQNLGVVTGAEGTLNKQAEIYAESWEAVKKRVQAAAEGIYQSLLDDKFFISINNGFATVLKGIDAFIDGAGGIKTVLMGIASVVISTFAHKIPQALDTLRYNLEFATKGSQVAYDRIHSDMEKATQAAFDKYQATTGQQGIKEDSSMGYAIKQANELTAARNKLALIDDKMSASEKQMANTELSLIEATQQEIISLKQKNEELQKSIDLQKQNIMKVNVGEKVSNNATMGLLDDSISNLQGQQEYYEKASQRKGKKQSSYADTTESYKTALTEIQQFAEAFDIYKNNIAQKYDELNKIMFESFTAGKTNDIINSQQLFGDLDFNQPKGQIDSMIQSIERLMATANETNRVDIFTAAKDEIAALSSTIPQAVQEATGLDKIFKQIASSSSTQNLDQLGKRIEQLKKGFKTVQIEGKQFEKVLKSFHGKSIDNLTGDMNKLAESERKAAAQARNLEKLLNNFNPKHVIRMSEAFGSLVGILGNVSMLMNSLKSIGNALSPDIDMTIWERISTIFMGLSMSIPAAMSMLKSFGTVMTWLTTVNTANTASLHAQSIAQNTDNLAKQLATVHSGRLANLLSEEQIKRVANIVATEKETGSTGKVTAAKVVEYLTENKIVGKKAAEFIARMAVKRGTDLQTASVWKLIWALLTEKATILGMTAPLGAIIALIAALAIAIVAVTKAAINAYNADKIAAENARKAVEDLTESYKRLTDEANTFKEAVSNYEDAVASLKTLEKGTDEYREALEKANEQARQLIETYGLWGQTHYDENGVITFNEDVLEDKQTEYDTRIREAESQLYSAKIASNEANIRSETTNLRRELGNIVTETVQSSVSNTTPYAASTNAYFATSPYAASQQQQIQSRQLTNDEVQQIAKALELAEQKVIAGEYDSLEAALGSIDEWNNLSDAVKGSIDAIIANKDAFAQLTNTMNNADSANEYYAGEIIRNTVEEQSGVKLREIATGTDGKVDEGLYNQLVNAAAEREKAKQAEYENGLADQIASATDYKNVTSTSDLKDFGDGRYADVNNEEDLAYRYAKDILNYKDEELATFDYREGDGVGTLVDAKGKAIMSEVNDEYMRQQLARKAEIDMITQQYEQDYMNQTGEGSAPAYIDSLGAMVEQSSAFGDKFGVDFTNHLLSAIANGTGTFDFSSLYSELSKAEKDELERMAQEDPEKLVKALGLTDEMLAQMGFIGENAATLFATSFQSGLEGWTEEDFIGGINSKYEKQAEDLGLDVDEFKAYRDMLAETNAELAKNPKLLNLVALAQKRYEKGSKKIVEIQEEYNDLLKLGAKELKETGKLSIQTMGQLSTILPDLKTAVSDLLDLDADSMKALSPTFLIENWEDIIEAINGSKEAYLRVQQAASKEILFDVGLKEGDALFTDFMTLAGSLQSVADMSPVELEAHLNSDEFLAACTQLVNQAGMTYTQAQAYFDELGYNAKVEVVDDPPVTTKTDMQVPIFKMTPDGGVSVEMASATASSTQNSQHLRITSINKKDTGGGGYTSSSPNKGGGGGGGSAPKHAEKKNDSDKERYHTLQNQLEDLKSEYDSISEAADRAFGKEKLKAIDDEINKTDELINKQEEYLDAIKENLPVDKAVMDAYYTDLIGGTIEYDERGNISNYDQIQDAMFDKYNQMAEMYDEDSEEWQVFEKKYEQLEKYIEQYEETYDLLRDEEEEYQNLLRQRIDLQLEKVQYSIEIQLEIPENEIAIIEYQLGKIEDDAFKSAEAIGLLTKKAENVYDQIQVNKQGLNDLLELSLSTQEIVQLMNGDMSVLEGKTFTEDQIDSIKEYRDNLLNLNEKLDDIRKNIEEQVMKVFDAWNEKLEQGIDKLDHYGNVLESYKNIIDIVGKDTLGLSDAFMATLNQSSIDNAINKVTATKKSYEAMVKAQSQAEQALEDAKARNDEASIKMWEENLQSITEEAQSAREEMLSAWEDALNGIAEQFEATVERLIENFNDSIYKLGGLEGLSEDFSRKKETQDLYVSDYQKIYELSKLTRDINNKIDDTDNIAGKQKLKKLLEQINELQKDGVEMSQYDLEYLQAEYDLRLAELELEEARNAKNTVRLQKDNEGNWSYIYTQNTDAVDQAQQKYEDALYAMQDLSSQYIDEMSEKLISTSQEMQEAIAAVRIQDFESQEAYYKEIDRIYRLYQDQLGQQESELNKAVANNKTLYDTDWTNYHNATGYKISDTENFVTTFKDSLLGTLLDSDQLTSNFSSIIGGTAGQLIENLMSAANDYYTNLNTAMEAAGTSTKTFSDILAKDILSIQTNSEIASEAVKSMAKQMDTSIGNIMSSVEKWQIDYGNQIDLILNKNLQLINSFNNMIKVLSGGDMSGIDISYNISRTQDQDTENIASGDTGMYTGNWGTKDGKLAILHEKELVLNANDTENMLNMLELTRYLTSVIDVNAKQLSQGIGLLQPATIKDDNREILEQQVHIQAEFPNVNDHNEIEEAFNSLINTASQYAYRK